MAEPSPNGNSNGAGDDSLLYAAFALAADPLACQALLHGEPVPRHRLNPATLAAIGEKPAGADITLTDALARSVELRLPHYTRAAETATPATGEGAEPQRPPLYIMPGGEFLDQPLANIVPLVGTVDDAIIMPASLLLCAGTGGAGKTTLEVHATLHFAAGVPWFGIPVLRPLRLLVIENEGPHDPFVRKVAEMARRWRNCPCGCEGGDGGAALRDNVFFLDSPWSRFSWDDPDYAEQLRTFVADNQIDLVMANPLGRLGMRGAGTPEETRAFLDLLIAGGLGRDFGAWINHHLVKFRPNVPIVQQVSGDWGPHADTILILEPDGERRGKLTFGKVRWGDQGRPPLLLEWLTDPDGPVGYRPHDAPVQQADDETLYQRIDAFLAGTNRMQLRQDIRRNVSGNNKRLGEVLDQGVADKRYRAHIRGSRTYYTLYDWETDEDDDSSDQFALPWE